MKQVPLMKLHERKKKQLEEVEHTPLVLEKVMARPSLIVKRK